MTTDGTIRRIGRRAVEILLWGGAGLGALSIAAAVAAVIFGIVPLVFMSGSMSPEIPTGALGLARTVDADELRVGDVVSVTSAAETRVTHRIVDIEEQPDGVVLSLQGDTNPSPDQESYRVAEADRVFFSVPHLGRVVVFLTSPWAMFLGGLAAAALLFWAFRRPPRSDGTAGGASQRAVPESTEATQRRTGGSKTKTRATLIAVGLTTALMATANSGSAAYWSDDATVTTTGFASHRVFQPGPITCTAAGGTITVETSNPDSRYTYWAGAYTKADPDPDGTSIRMSGDKQLTGKPPEVSFKKSELSSLAVGVTYYLRIHSRVAATGAAGPSAGWESFEYRRQPFSWNGALLSCNAATPPAITFVQPTDGSTKTPLEIVTACERDTNGYGSGDPLACGTATDNGTVQSVQYVFRRTGSRQNCWHGNWGNNCMYRPAARNEALGRWAIPGDGNNPFNNPSNYKYTLSVKVTDNDGYVSEESITFNVK